MTNNATHVRAADCAQLPTHHRGLLRSHITRPLAGTLAALVLAGAIAPQHAYAAETTGTITPSMVATLEAVPPRWASRPTPESRPSRP